MFNMESTHLLNLSAQVALLKLHLRELQSQKFFGAGACTQNSLEPCNVRSPDGHLIAPI